MSVVGRDLLIVDDDASLRRSLGRVFSRVGWSTREAGDGLDAIACIQARTPDVVLTDMRMPRMGGLELIHWMRASGHADIRVVVLSGYHYHGERELHALGVHAVLAKPIDLDRLREAVARAAQPEA